MTAHELATLFNISIAEAQHWIERSDAFDRSMDELYDLEAVQRFEQGLDDLVEEADWNSQFG